MSKTITPIYEILLNEQTPETQNMQEPKKWIEANKNMLESFLYFSHMKKKAAALASNQIAFHGKRISDRFFAVRQNGRGSKWMIVINPFINRYMGSPLKLEEKCLSWPGKVILAKRYPRIEVSFYKQNGEFVEDMVLEGYEAQVWQHEIDHLNGQEEKFKEVIEERREKATGRNDPCPCKSGKKYKKCCGI